jgi:phosphatidylinositol N-acetylglucosaminyltransferase subunit C
VHSALALDHWDLLTSPDPDNYTDASTFLDHLKRNKNLQPYQFWHLVADSTVIVQQVCSVAIFVCCFTGIFQERVSPITVVSWGSAGTIVGWITCDIWVGQEQDLAKILGVTTFCASDEESSFESVGPPSGTQTPRHSISEPFTDDFHPPTAQVYGDPLSKLSPLNQQRLATVKSAALIYCAVLGMSPILKSLTKSTTSDSIWAMSGWLMGINVFFFDYGGSVGAK